MKPAPKLESWHNTLLTGPNQLLKFMAFTSVMATAALAPMPARSQEVWDVPAKSFEDIVKPSTLQKFQKLKVEYDETLRKIRNWELIQNVPQMTQCFAILDTMKDFLRGIEVADFSETDMEFVRSVINQELKTLAWELSHTLANNMSLDLTKALWQNYPDLKNLAAAKLKGFNSEDGGFTLASNIYAIFRNERWLINEE